MGLTKAQLRFRRNSIKNAKGQIISRNKEALALRDSEKNITEELTTTAEDVGQEQQEHNDIELLESIDLTLDTAHAIIENGNITPLELPAIEEEELPTTNEKLRCKSGADKRFRGAYTGDSKANVNKKKAKLAINTDPSKPDNRLMTDFTTVSKPIPIIRKKFLASATATTEKQLIMSSGTYEEICAIISPKISKSSEFNKTKVYEMVRYISVKEYMDEIIGDKRKMDASIIVAQRHWTKHATEHRALIIRQWFKEFMEYGCLTQIKCQKVHSPR